MLTLNIRLFGAFKQLLNANEFTVSVPAKITVAELRKALLIAMTPQTQYPEKLILIQHSAVANEERILADDECIVEASVLALLPPCSGG